MGHVDNEIPTASTKILTIAPRCATDTAPTHSSPPASANTGVPNTVPPGPPPQSEHGTGRVMAPYVRRQYGDELYDVMVSIKRLIDPVELLNPGVLLDDAPDAHLRHIKVTPTIEEEVDRCVECGYSEPVCPSRDLTLTPRQRIVVRRAIASAESGGD